MSSLTPKHRNQEATNEAMQEGLVSGTIVLVPSLITLYLAMRNQTFIARTNWQSRTAMTIMPALFAFGYTAENRLHEKMVEIAQETQHHTDTVKWAEQQQQQQQQHGQQHGQQQHGQQEGSSATTATGTVIDHDKEIHLMSLYKHSIEESGVKIVPGNELSLHHRVANYVAANPIKALAVMAVPSVGLILYGRTGKEHLQMSVKILHTRVFGQFTTLALLLSIMGFKEFMDQNGRFITEVEANRRVEEMKSIRQQLSARLEHEQQIRQDQEQELAQLHSEDIKNAKKRNHQHQRRQYPKNNHEEEGENTTTTTTTTTNTESATATAGA